jgi:crotonobetaine/carnitine-CoA ligase
MESARLLQDLLGRDRGSVAELWEARCRATPSATFLLYEGRRWSYAEAWEESRRVAGFLEANAGPRPRVSTYLSKRPEALWAWFGTTLAGGLHCALNRAHKGAVLADMAARSRPEWLVTEKAAWDGLPEPAKHDIARVLFVDEAPPGIAGIEVRDWSAVARAAPAEPVPSTPSDPVCLLYTSGTTGRSKAVLVPHNMYARGGANVAAAFGMGPTDVIHDWMPLSHVGGQMHMTLSAVASGACLAMYETFSRSKFWEQIAQCKATIFFGFSNILTLLMMAPESPADRRHGLRVGLVAHMQAAQQTAFEKRFGVKLWDTYGMSEGEPMTLPAPGVPAGCSGAPGPDFELAIVDEDDNLLPPGQVGRIVARPRAADVMMKGYEGDEAATVEAWRNLWFHTQDLGKLDEHGFLWYVDRLKHSIRHGNENVSSAEVERALKMHPRVHEAAVVGVPDPIAGEAVKAVIVPKPGERLEPGEIHAYARDSMACFMVPRYIEVREVLPYTDIGKVKRDALREIGPDTWDSESKGA